MQFNFCFDIASLIFLLVIVWRYFTKRHFPLLNTTYYGIMLVLTCLILLLDIWGTVLITPVGAYPILLAYIVNTMYYVILIALPTALVLYIISLVSLERHIPDRYYIYFAIPAVIAELILLIGVPMGWIFNISLETGYTYGPLSKITYLTTGIYILASIILILYYRHELTRETKVSFLVMLLFLIICLSVQLLYPNLLLSGTGVTLSLFIIHFSLQDPDKMLDETTQCFNYSAFLSFLRARKLMRRSTNIVIVHLHNLRRINTLHGIEEGDKVLRYLGDYLSEGERNWVFRIGDTQFAVLTTNKNEHLRTLGRIIQKTTINWEVNGRITPLDLTVCHLYGIEKLKHRQQVMNAVEWAKNIPITDENSSRIIEIDETVLETVQRETELENVIRNALPTGEHFHLVFQPIYNCVTGRFDSAETLLRFHHPVYGTVFPDEFVSLIEKNGMATLMDEMVVRKVFDIAAKGTFDQLGLEYVHINLSAASFMTKDITETIISMAQSMQIDPGRFAFEITETVATTVQNIFDDCLALLTNAGFKLSLDDFGTGYANFTRLMGLPFSIIKLDRSLLVEARQMFEDIVRIIQHLNCLIVAEGIETEEQAEFVQASGVGFIQGYYYAKPMPLQDFTEFLESKTK